jgi:hypothetical protein
MSGQRNDQYGEKSERPIRKRQTRVVLPLMAPSPAREYKQQNSGGGAEPQMQAQISPKLCALQLQLPREHSADYGGRRCYGSRNQVVVSRSRRRSTAAPERQQIECKARHKQSDGEVDDDDVLRVPGEQCRSEVKRVHVVTRITARPLRQSFSDGPSRSSDRFPAY